TPEREGGNMRFRPTRRRASGGDDDGQQCKLSRVSVRGRVKAVPERSEGRSTKGRVSVAEPAVYPSRALSSYLLRRRPPWRDGAVQQVVDVPLHARILHDHRAPGL